MHCLLFFFLLFTAPAPTHFYTLSLHDALPISITGPIGSLSQSTTDQGTFLFSTLIPGIYSVKVQKPGLDRKSTRLNSSHQIISYAVFCLKKKKTNIKL